MHSACGKTKPMCVIKCAIAECPGRRSRSHPHASKRHAKGTVIGRVRTATHRGRLQRAGGKGVGGHLRHLHRHKRAVHCPRLVHSGMATLANPRLITAASEMRRHKQEGGYVKRPAPTANATLRKGTRHTGAAGQTPSVRT